MAGARGTRPRGAAVTASGLRLTWTLTGAGWADCALEDHQGRVTLTASHLSDAPAALLTAVARLLAGAAETRAQFEAEPTAFRWIFYREGEDAWVRVLELREGVDHDARGTELWSRPVGVDELVRAVVRCFDEVERVYGVGEYRGRWGGHFPGDELRALRRLWQERQRAR